MEVCVFRNLSAIRFVRCAVPVPGSDLYAGGAGLTLGEALAKCQSERIERQFELQELRPRGIRPEGIAAHRTVELAQASAAQEATESFCVREIHSQGLMQCLWRIRFRSFALGLARTENGYLCLIRGTLAGRAVAAHSAARTTLGALLKTWEEYQSFHFFKPAGLALKNYSKANHLFSEAELEHLEFRLEPTFIYRPQLSALTVAQAARFGRKIVYLYRGKER